MQNKRMQIKPTSNVKILLMLTVNPLSANPTKWSNILKQFACNRNFVGLPLKGLMRAKSRIVPYPICLYFERTFYTKWDYFCLSGCIF